MPTADIIIVSDAVTRVVAAREQNKIRIISDSITVSESIALYKNGVLVVPAPPEIPTPQNIIGFRQRALRPLRRAPRAILIEAELTNLIIAPLKLLAFSDSINKAIVGIKPRPALNVARVGLLLSKSERPTTLAYCPIKMQPEAMQVKARLALLSSPEMWATAKLKTRPESQSIHALKAVNFEKMYKLTRIMKIAILAESL